jgi:hypothetical protein
MKTQSTFVTAILGTTSIVGLQLLGGSQSSADYCPECCDVANNNQSFLVSQATNHVFACSTRD